MRKIIVSNFLTLDGYYDGKDKNLSAIFEYFHEDYSGDDNFDFYNTERMRSADTLLLSGRTSFLGNKEYWSGLLDRPQGHADPARVCATHQPHRESGCFGQTCPRGVGPVGG